MKRPMILYVCECCYENAPEVSGRTDPKEIAVMPDGAWLCEVCVDETSELVAHGVKPSGHDEDEWPVFSDFPHPPEYRAVEATPEPA